MNALKILRLNADEIVKEAHQASLSPDQVLASFLKKYGDELDEHSLNNIGTIEQKIKELLRHEKN